MVNGGLGLIKHYKQDLEATQVFLASVVTLVIWNWISNLRRERELIWPLRWSLTKCLFLFLRIWLVFMVVQILVLSNIDVTPAVCKKVWMITPISYLLILSACGLILALRTVVMHQFRRSVIIVTATSWTTMVITLCLCLGMKAYSRVDRDITFGLYKSCVSVSVRPWSLVFWAAPVAFDLIMLYYSVRSVMTVRKTENKAVLNVLTYDVYFAFFFIFSTHFANIIVLSVARATIQELVSGLAVAISAIMSNFIVFRFAEIRHDSRAEVDAADEFDASRRRSQTQSPDFAKSFFTRSAVPAQINLVINVEQSRERRVGDLPIAWKFQSEGSSSDNTHAICPIDFDELEDAKK